MLSKKSCLMRFCLQCKRSLRLQSSSSEKRPPLGLQHLPRRSELRSLTYVAFVMQPVSPVGFSDNKCFIFYWVFTCLQQSRWPSSTDKSNKVLLRQYRQTPIDPMGRTAYSNGNKTNNLTANYIKSQGMVRATETGIKSLKWGKVVVVVLLSNSALAEHGCS